MQQEPKTYRKKRLVDAAVWQEFLAERERLNAAALEEGKPVLEASRSADRKADEKYADQGILADGYIAKCRWTKSPAKKKTVKPAAKSPTKDVREKVFPSGEDAEYRQVLIEAAVEANTGRINPRKEIEWVYLNIAIPWSEIDGLSVPSSGAITLLTEAKLAPTWFLEKHYAKLLSIKDEIGKAEAEELEGNIHIDELVAEAGILDRRELIAVGLAV